MKSTKFNRLYKEIVNEATELPQFADPNGSPMQRVVA